jgi:pimeloyl-ACP methyl ester carboxylesterase
MGDTHTLTLPDGRTLAYSDHGTGPLVLDHTGTPGTRLVDPVQVAQAERLGYRLVQPDRPGFGRSDPHPGRTVESWASDARALVDALGVERFAVAGSSGGGAYAVACGAVLGDRVTAVALACPGAPTGTPTNGFVPREESALRERGETFARLLRDDPDGFFAMVAPDESETDRQTQEAMDPQEKARTIEFFREAFRQGADAYVTDHLLNQSDWGHLLPRLTRPTRIWQGDDDNNVPIESTRWLAAQIPGVTLTVVPGAGHQLTDASFAEMYTWLVQSFSTGA